MEIIIRDVEEVDGRYKVKYKDGAGGFFYVDKQTAEAVSIPIEPPVKPEIAEERLNNIKGCVDRIWSDCFDAEQDYTVNQMEVISKAITEAKLAIEKQFSV